MTPSTDAAAVAEWLKTEVRAGRLPRRLDPVSEARIAAIVTSSQKKTAGRAGLRQAAQTEGRASATSART